jgi:hypothetical protein
MKYNIDMKNTAEMIPTLDKMIADTERRLGEAKRFADMIPALSSDLAALRRARDLAAHAHDSVTIGFSEKASVKLSPPSTAEPTAPTPILTELVLQTLVEAGRPMLVPQIVEAVRRKVPTAKEVTLVSHLVRFVQKGRVRRVAPSTYEFVK